MRNIKEIALSLYNVMNAIDCGCTDNFEEQVWLCEGERYAEFEALENSDKYRLYVFEGDSNSPLHTLIVGYADVSDNDQATIDMFEKMLDENKI